MVIRLTHLAHKTTYLAQHGSRVGTRSFYRFYRFLGRHWSHRVERCSPTNLSVLRCCRDGRRSLLACSCLMPQPLRALAIAQTARCGQQRQPTAPAPAMSQVRRAQGPFLRLGFRAFCADINNGPRGPTAALRVPKSHQTRAGWSTK